MNSDRVKDLEQQIADLEGLREYALAARDAGQALLDQINRMKQEKRQKQIALLKEQIK